MIRLFIYALSLIISTFAVSGINFEHIIKKNHIWEARILSMLLVLGLTYLLANLILDIGNINIFN